jgi:hypothetical protein
MRSLSFLKGVCLFAVILFSRVDADEAVVTSESAIAESKVVEIPPDDINYYITAAPSGVFELDKSFEMRSVGETISGRLELINDTGSDLVMKHIRTTCGCLTAEVRLAKVEVGKRFVLRYSLPIAKGLTAAVQSAIIDCDGAIDQIRVTFNVPVKDAVVLSQSLNAFRPDAKEKMVAMKIPFIMSSSLTFKDVTVSATGDLSQVKWRYERGEQYGEFLIGEFPFDEIPPSGVIETIKVESKPTGFISEAQVQIFSTELVRITPNTLTFYREANDEPHAANALATIDSTLLEDTDQAYVTANIDGKHDGKYACKIEKTKLGDRVLKLRLTIDSEVLSESLKTAGDSEPFVEFEVAGQKLKRTIQVR